MTPRRLCHLLITFHSFHLKAVCGIASNLSKVNNDRCEVKTHDPQAGQETDYVAGLNTNRCSHLFIVWFDGFEERNGGIFNTLDRMIANH